MGGGPQAVPRAGAASAGFGVVTRFPDPYPAGRRRRAIRSLALLSGALLVACSGPRTPAGEVYSFSPDERPGARAEGTITAAALREVYMDPVALNYVVMSRIYAEDPSSLYLTTRGGGLSVYDLADPRRPKLVGRASPKDDVEGQDRLGDLLVVVARDGRLFTYDASDRTKIRKLAELELKTRPGIGARIRGKVFEWIGNGPFDALHATLYRPTKARTLCMVTAPNSRELIAVDVTNPAKPRQIGSVDTEISFVEAITIKGHYAFVGGFGMSRTFSVVDIADPKAMKIVRTLSDPAYRQLVSAISPERPNTMFVALWDDPGGLGAFDVTRPAEFTEIGRITSHELRRANRVKLAGDYAFLPLESKPGGFGVIDISRPRDLRVAAVVLGIRGVTLPYTVHVHDDWLYVFGTKESSMAVFELLRAPAKEKDPR